MAPLSTTQRGVADARSSGRRWSAARARRLAWRVCSAWLLCLAWLLCTACERPVPSATPLDPPAERDAGVPGAQQKFPAGGAADAGLLSFEDADTTAVRQDGGQAWPDAGPTYVPPSTSGRKPVTLSCESLGGRTVWFSASRAPPQPVVAGGSSFEVLDGPQALSGMPTSGAPQWDPQRQRLVRIHIQGVPSARVASVMETDTQLVVLLDLPAYCGGPAPFSPSFDVVIARSAKPVSVRGCGHGQCAGPPLP